MAYSPPLSANRSTAYNGTNSANPVNSTGAKLLVAEIMFGTASMNIVDSKGGNTWVKLPQYALDSGKVQWAYCLSPANTGAGHYITETDGSVNSSAIIHMYAFTCDGTPTYTSGQVSGATDGSATGTSCQPGSLTPPANGALILVGAQLPSGGTSGHAINSGFTVALTNTESVSGYLIQTTAAAINPTVSWDGSSRWAVSMVSFGETAPPAGPTLSAPAKSDTTTTATGGFTTTGTDGTARMVWIESSTAPTAPNATQVKAGQNASGSTTGVVAPAALTITSSGAKTFAAATVNTQKTHWGFVVHTNAAGTDSNVLPLGAVYPGTWRSVSDVTVTGWTVTGAATHAEAIDEDAPGSGAEFITSPGLTSTAATHLTALDKTLPAGTYNEQITASVNSGTGLLSVAFLDSGGTVQGQTAEQAITTTPTTYTLPVTTTGAATRKRISVRTP